MRSRASSETSRKIRFGSFEVTSQPFELHRGSDSIPLQPQPARALLYLIEHAGRVITREDLRREIWGTETYLDYEQGINFMVRKIRSALGDDPAHPQYIETLPRVGYRFVAPVKSRPAGRSRSPRPAVLVGLGLTLVLSGVALYRTLAPTTVDPSAQKAREVQTLALGHEVPEGIRERYLRGLVLLADDEPVSGHAAQLLLYEILLDEPDFALGHLALAKALLKQSSHEPLDEVLPAVKRAASRALQIDPGLVEAIHLQGVAELFLDLDPDTACTSLQRAVALAPLEPLNRQTYGACLSARGEHDAALEQIRTAVSLDPVDLVARSDLIRALFRAERYAEAIEEATHSLIIDPQGLDSRDMIYQSLRALGREELAREQARELAHLLEVAEPQTIRSWDERKLAYLRGLSNQGRAVGFEIAAALVGLGRIDDALVEVQRACRDERSWELPYLGVDPRFEPLREDPESWLESCGTTLQAVAERPNGGAGLAG